MKFLIPPFVLICIFCGWILGVEEEAKGIFVLPQPGGLPNEEVKKLHKAHGVLYSMWDEKKQKWMFQDRKGRWCDLLTLPLPGTKKGKKSIRKGELKKDLAEGGPGLPPK